MAGRSARIREGLGRAARLAGKALLLFVAASVLEVLVVRFVNPPCTWTMVEQAIEHHQWVDHRAIRLQDAGDVPRAFVASEDARFFLHHGFDWGSVCAAIEHNAEGGTVHGASTITQQVAKNVFLWQGRSWLRKGLEAWYTVLLELLVPKSRILELYLNVAETGPLVFGAESGARHHFGKPAGRLTMDEAARLAGILPDPDDRSVNGGAATRRAQFVAEHPAPFPGDPGWDEVKAAYAKEPHGPWACFAR